MCIHLCYTHEGSSVVGAEMFVTAQTDGSITISCRGDTPQIDIPILITLLG